MTTVKSKSASKSKTPARKSIEPAELEKLQVTQNGLATILGIAPNNVASATANGTLEKNADGRFDLVAQVRDYIRALRERSKGGDKSTLETEALALKNEKAKTYLENWRRDRDRQIAGAIVESLRGALLAFRENVERGMAVNAAIDAVLDGLEAVDLEIVLEPLEQDEEEDEA